MSATIRHMPQSDDVVIQAPFSYIGSAKRLWKPARKSTGIHKVLWATTATVVIMFAWLLVTLWYLCVVWWTFPYRMVRRSQRRSRRDHLAFQEMWARQNPPTEVEGPYSRTDISDAV